MSAQVMCQRPAAHETAALVARAGPSAVDGSDTLRQRAVTRHGAKDGDPVPAGSVCTLLGMGKQTMWPTTYLETRDS